MKSANKAVSRPAQSWGNRVKRSRQTKVDYYSELRDWVQHVISEAEKSRDLKKKEQFLGLLKDVGVV